ncbi:MAG: hypothetical protein KKA42_07480 [candidate division Zixibacteria bacterium]|nr:hypothetical protein [candidate division Zixibacteria bacterium]
MNRKPLLTLVAGYLVVIVLVVFAGGFGAPTAVLADGMGGESEIGLTPPDSTPGDTTSGTGMVYVDPDMESGLMGDLATALSAFGLAFLCM